MTHETQGPLKGVRVMDLTIQAAGPWTTALLGMLGAEVIKVERPTGDGTRWALPSQRGMGTNYIAMNVNKKNVILDLKSEEGRAAAMKLAATCDVLVQNFRVGVIERLGLGYDDMRRLNPRLIHCSVSGFGATGPLAKAGCGDPTMQAFSGFARSNGGPDDAVEAFRFTGLLDLATASVSASLILAALFDRDATGNGQKIEISMLEAALEIQCTRIAELLGAGLVPRPRGSESPGLVPDRAFQALDREVFVTVHNDAEWAALCRAIEKPELAADPRYATNAARVERREEVNALLAEIIRARPAIWWLRVCQRHGVACGLGHHFETFRFHQQIVENDMIARLATRDWGEVSVGGVPWHFSRTPCEVREPARPDEHTQSVLAQLDDWKNEQSLPAGATRLKGLRVVELAEGVAGPLAGLHLRELGADVVKVEAGGGDWLRHALPALKDEKVGAAFHALNRGKRSFELDDEPMAARAAMEALLQNADVFITDRSEADLEALGLCTSGDTLLLSNPRLVSVVVSPWGRYGPLAQYKGSELTAQAMAGYTRYLGAYGQPARRLGADVASAGTGVFALQAVLAALYERNRTHRGQRVDVSLVNSLLAMKSVHLAAQSDPDAYEGPRVGGANHAPQRGWKTADDPIFFKFGGAIGSDREGWVDFVREIGLERMLDDPRCDKAGRLSTSHGLYSLVLRPVYEEAFVRYRADELFSIIRKHGGDVAIYLSAAQTLEHPQTRALNIERHARDPHGRDISVRAFPGRFSMLEPRIDNVAPDLGEHTEVVMSELTPNRRVHGGFA